MLKSESTQSSFSGGVFFWFFILFFGHRGDLSQIRDDGVIWCGEAHGKREVYRHV